MNKDSAIIYGGTLATFWADLAHYANWNNAVGFLTALYTLLRIYGWFKKRRDDQ